MKLFLRNLQKVILHNFILPFAYFCFKYQTVDNELVIFADSKNDGIPYSLKAMHNEVEKRNYKIIDYCFDFEKLSAIEKLVKTIKFMKLYAKAKYIFICDYYLPISSCNKRAETKVIQLWHASGLQKKFGFDTKADLGSLKFLKPTRNFDLVSVSAVCMVSVMANNWRLPAEKIKVLGTSRSDIFFDKKYIEACKKRFYETYPDAQHKKVIMWAPSFRGNGSNADIKGIDEVITLSKNLEEKFYFIIKLHPHLHSKYNIDTCNMSTEELYPVVDILITDYSSVFYDFLLIKKNVIFYVPDYKQYISERGMYIDYEKEFKFSIAHNVNKLKECIRNYKEIEDNEVNKYREKFIYANDGKASERIMNYLEGDLI